VGAQEDHHRSRILNRRYGGRCGGPGEPSQWMSPAHCASSTDVGRSHQAIVLLAIPAVREAPVRGWSHPERTRRKRAPRAIVVSRTRVCGAADVLAPASERWTRMEAGMTSTTASAATSTGMQSADVLVVFGITGDLARVMTFYSLYRLEARGLLACPLVGGAGVEVALR